MFFDGLKRFLIVFDFLAFYYFKHDHSIAISLYKITTKKYTFYLFDYLIKGTRTMAEVKTLEN